MKITALKNPSRKPYIYKVTNLETGQYYIGSQCSGKTIGHNYFTSSTNKNFQDDFKNYREEKYKIEIVREFEDPDECVRVENYMISDQMQLKDGLCLNRACCCSGKKVFSTVGTHHSEKSKQKISLAKKGIPRSEESKQKMSKAHKGQSLSEETRKKLSEALKGTHPSEETRKKISRAKKGIPPSEETRKKLSEAHKGQSHSEETRKKMSEAHKGRPAINRIKISIEGMVFDSCKEASKYYNVGRGTISRWLKTKKHNTKKHNTKKHKEFS